MTTEVMQHSNNMSESPEVLHLDEQNIQTLNQLYARNLLPVSVVWGILAVLGLVGNFMVLVAFGFGNRLKARPLRAYIIGLAVIDVISCTILIPAEIYKQSNYFSRKERNFCRMKCFFHIFCMACTTFILVCVAVNRYIAITRPLNVKQLVCHSARKVVIWLLIITAATLLATPSAIFCGSYFVTVNNVTALACGADESTKSSKFRAPYKYLLGIMQVAFNIVLIALYVRMVLTIRRKSPSVTSGASVCTYDDRGKLRRRLGNRLPTNTKILFIVTMIFIFTYILTPALAYIELSTIPVHYFPLYAFFLRLYFIHSVILPVLYLKMDKSLRVAVVSRIPTPRGRMMSTSSTTSAF